MTALHTDTSLFVPYFNVLTGRHAGACVPLENTVCRVGAGVSCDLVLGEGTLAAEHFILRLSRGYVTVEATGGDVTIDAGTHLPMGSGCRFRLPIDVRVHDLHMRIAYPGGRVPHAVQPVVSRVGATASVAAIAAGLLGLYVVAGWGNAEAFASRLPQAERATVAPAPREVASAGQVPDAAAALRARLAQVGLDRFNIDANGSYVRVSGSADASGMAAWRDTQRWFDGAYGRTHVLDPDVRAAAAAPVPNLKLRAAWLGPNPYVIGERGDRLYPGAALADGWVLRRIDSGGIVFARQGDEYTFTL